MHYTDSISCELVDSHGVEYQECGSHVYSLVGTHKILEETEVSVLRAEE